MNLDRSWMYRRTVNGKLEASFLEGVDSFIAFAISHPACMVEGTIKCPCNLKDCRNKQYLSPTIVVEHLKNKGFLPLYETWDHHGEMAVPFMQYEHFGKRRKIKKKRVECSSENTNNSHAFTNQFEEMVFNAAGLEFMDSSRGDIEGGVEEPPNLEDQIFFDLLEAAKQPIWSGCKKHTELSLLSTLFSLKAEGGQSEKNFNDYMQVISDCCPEGENKVPTNYYQAKKKMRGFGLPMEKIDCCPDMCMIYWGEDVDLLKCKFCGKDRYSRYKEGAAKNRQKKNLSHKKMWYFPLAPRLKRLFASTSCADKMRWHKERVIPESAHGKMVHPGDLPAWKHFDTTYPEFAKECRNVRLGLCSDGFNPFGSERKYSCWPVMLTPYNLPPGDCLKEPFMFLTVLVPGPDDPGLKLDVFLQPLVKELGELWDNGIPAYDVSTKTNFTLRAALLWTVSDFPAYSMLSGRKTAEKHACPHCMEDTDAFRLSGSAKETWFDCRRRFLPTDHPFRKNKNQFRKNRVEIKGPSRQLTGAQTLVVIDGLGLMKVTELGWEKHNRLKSKGCGWKKKSIFWNLPYWSSLLIRHMLDVMHIEKNVFENCFNTICNIPNKTKDTIRSRQELDDWCKRPELSKMNDDGKWPKACYTLEKEARNTLFDWVKAVKFPDNYASKLGRCVDMNKTKMYGMKSHDCHVFMERLVPVAFKELLPKHVWTALTDVITQI
ncbi:hypothetical protein OROGR_014176 [Orobanche gracilis]